MALSLKMGGRGGQRRDVSLAAVIDEEQLAAELRALVIDLQGGRAADGRASKRAERPSYRKLAAREHQLPVVFDRGKRDELAEVCYGKLVLHAVGSHRSECQQNGVAVDLAGCGRPPTARRLYRKAPVRGLRRPTDVQAGKDRHRDNRDRNHATHRQQPRPANSSRRSWWRP